MIAVEPGTVTDRLVRTSAARGPTPPCGGCGTRAGAWGWRTSVRFDHRAFPLELFNSQATPRNELEPEIPACSSPCATRRLAAVGGAGLGLAGNHAARHGGGAGRQGAGPGRLGGARPRSAPRLLGREPLHQPAARDPGGRLRDRRPGPAAAGRGTRLRARSAAHLRQWEIAKTDAVQGSPHFFVSDGTNAQNPGVDADWREEPAGVWIPTITRDDPIGLRRPPAAARRVTASGDLTQAAAAAFTSRGTAAVPGSGGWACGGAASVPGGLGRDRPGRGLPPGDAALRAARLPAGCGTGTTCEPGCTQSPGARRPMQRAQRFGGRVACRSTG